MATKNSGLQLHQTGEIDLIDALAAVIFGIGGLVTTGLATITIIGEPLTMELWASSGSRITLATLMSLLPLALAYATNHVDKTDFDEIELGVVLAMFAVIVMMALAPGIRDIVTGSVWIGATVYALHVAGYYLLAYY